MYVSFDEPTYIHIIGLAVKSTYRKSKRKSLVAVLHLNGTFAKSWDRTSAQSQTE